MADIKSHYIKKELTVSLGFSPWIGVRRTNIRYIYCLKFKEKELPFYNQSKIKSTKAKSYQRENYIYKPGHWPSG